MTRGESSACAASGFLGAYLLPTWQKEWPWSVGVELPGATRRPPSEPEVEPGSLDVRNEVEPGSGAG